jgi:hypothetical protein
MGKRGLSLENGLRIYSRAGIGCSSYFIFVSIVLIVGTGTIVYILISPI